MITSGIAGRHVYARTTSYHTVLSETLVSKAALLGLATYIGRVDGHISSVLFIYCHVLLVGGPREDPGQAGETMSLGTSRDPCGRAGRSIWGEGSLCFPALTAALATRSWISGRSWMDGYGYRISMGHIHKALSWPTIKTDDGEAVNALALFLTSCCNAMRDMEVMRELDNVGNMHAIVSNMCHCEQVSMQVKGEVEKPCLRYSGNKGPKTLSSSSKQSKVVLLPLFGDIKDS